jgi:fructan beta-fructosidase
MTKSKTETLLEILPTYHVSSIRGEIWQLSHFFSSKNTFHWLIQSTKPGAESPAEFLHLESPDGIKWQFSNQRVSAPTPPGYRSGFILIDSKNSSGFGTGSKAPWILVYTTQADPHILHLMYSTDHGIHWNADRHKLVDFGSKSGMDPFIFWHEPSQRWILVVTVPDEYKVRFYSSKNLIKWEYLNDFGGHPSFRKKWQSATLIPISFDNLAGKSKWVLFVSASGEFSGVRYFIGEFNGTYFSCDHALDLFQPVDIGKDFYWLKPCLGLFPKRNIIAASIYNTAYVDHILHRSWKNMFTIPREISLLKEPDGSARLIQRFIPEIAHYRSNEKEFPKSKPSTEVEWDLDISDHMELELKIESYKGCTLEFDFGNKTKLLLVWDAQKHTLTLDRTAKPFMFHPDYASLETASVAPGHSIQLHLLLDTNMLECIADAGRLSLTTIFLTPNTLQRFRMIGKQFAVGGIVRQLRPAHA